MNSLVLRTFAVLIGACLVCPARADSHRDPFLPGYRYTQVWLEDSRKLWATGIDVAWAAIQTRGFELDLGTGLSGVSRHPDDHLIPAWTAHMALTAPKPVAPYLELGFDLGEAVTRNLLERTVEDPETWEQVRPDSWFAAGLRITIHPEWALKLYYKQRVIDGLDFRDLHREVLGFAVVRRVPRVHLLWWQRPL